MKNKPLIDIIIPAYNAEKSIIECIESIENQSYKDIHIIVVNDGSKDNTVLKLEPLIMKYGNIELINQSNQGVGAARNKGLNYLKGDYIVFVDSDDKIAFNYIEQLVKTMKKEEVDIVEANLIKTGKNVVYKGKVHKIKVANNLHGFFEKYVIDSSHQISYGVIGKMFRGDFIKKNNLTFLEGMRFGEDLLFLMNAYFYSPIIAFNKNAKYFYLENSESITRKKNPNRCYEQYYIFESFFKTQKHNVDKNQMLFGELFWLFVVSGLSLSIEEGADYEIIKRYITDVVNDIAGYKLSYRVLFEAAIRWSCIEGKGLFRKIKVLVTICAIRFKIMWYFRLLLLGKKNENKKVYL